MASSCCALGDSWLSAASSCLSGRPRPLLRVESDQGCLGAPVVKRNLKRDLVEAVRSGQVTVLLATDAASEGLNRQAASYLINYDMPWNPMRVEQRIGRIDRLGPVRDVVHIRHYFVPGTVEEAVYNAVAGRIDDFRALLGTLQPILGATEQAFKAVFRAPRSERAAAQVTAIRNLLAQVDRLDTGGADLPVEDPWPIPPPGATPVRLSQLRQVVQDRFGAALDELGRPATWDPTRPSRDAEGWVVLATYGHPRLREILTRYGADQRLDRSAAVLAADCVFRPTLTTQNGKS